MNICNRLNSDLIKPRDPDINNSKFLKLIEPCESGLFSLYINVKGESYFCSFLEGEEIMPAFNLMDCEDFMNDVWFHPDMIKWRKNLLGTAKYNEISCRECPKYLI